MGDVVRGIGYDAGVLYDLVFDSFPDFTLEKARRDMRAIREDLGCDAVLIMASDPQRLEIVGRCAAEVGLSVWLQPRPFDQPVEVVREVVRRTAAIAEELRLDGADVGVVVGCEMTLSTPGMVPGRTFSSRGSLLTLTWPLLPWANLKLRRLLADLVGEVRARFTGPVSYGAGDWERPDWEIFDGVGLDRYRESGNAWRFEDDLRALVEGAAGKPVYVFEFGTCAYRGAADKASTASGVLGSLDAMSVPRRLVRDEQEQADYLTDLLDIFERCGVAGAFVWGFHEPALITSDQPGRDLDLASYGIVTVHADGTWTPKLAFHALARRNGR